MGSKQEFIHLSKLDAAKRQLEIAIRLFLSNSDIVAIHSLAASSHTLLRDLSKKRGKNSWAKDKVLGFVKPEFRKKYIDTINKPDNFIKHADRDAEEILKFVPLHTEILLIDSCSMYQILTSELTPYIMSYRMWFFTNYPDTISNDNVKSEVINFVVEVKKLKLDPSNRQQFLDLSSTFSGLPK